MEQKMHGDAKGINNYGMKLVQNVGETKEK